MNDDFELRLRAAFRGPLPAAPVTLHDALDRVTAEPVVAQRTRGRAPWALLGVAALLATGLVVGLTVGSPNGLVAPSQPTASSGTPAPSASEAPVLGLTFEARPADGSQPDDALMNELVALVRARLDLVGDADATVERIGGSRVLVRIPAWIDADEVRAMLSHVGRVDVVPLGQAALEPGTTIDPTEYPTLLGRAAIEAAEAGTDDNGAPKLTLRLTEEATPVFAEFSADHVGEFLALTVDHQILVVPVLNNSIADGVIEITAPPDGLDPDEVRRLVAIIDAGGPLGTFRDGELQPIPFVEILSEPSPAP
jgi:hypothetical protein